MKDLLKTTATVLGKHKLPATALEQVHTSMREAKEKLDSILGLSESNLFRAPISLERSEADVRNDYPQTYAVISHVLNQAVKAGSPLDLGSISLVRNSVLSKGQEGKLSRVLAKQLKGQEEVLSHCMKELKITKPEQFLPKLGDIVKSGRKLWVSTNILDFLAASQHASFESCHGMDGCHFNGNIAYARDGHTVITFVSEEKATAAQHEIYKLGRSWLFVVDHTIVQPKSYGAYYDFERDMARQFIEEKLAGSLGVANKWSHLSGQTIPRATFEKPDDKYSGSGALYLDNYDLDVSCLSTEKFKVPSILFSAAMCLECGQTTDYPSKGVCSEHDGKIKVTCAICGTRHLTDNMHTTDEGSVCPECYSEHFSSCQHCGGSHRKEKLENIDGTRCCAACKKKVYATCECCGELVKKGSQSSLTGVGQVCAKCSDKFLLCSICGKYHPKEKVEYYKYVGRVCAECVPNHTFTCGGCGEIHPLADKKVIDGEANCPACIARRKGDTLILKEKPKYANLPEGWDDFIEVVG